MKGINYRVIPHSEQRYETVGDYWLDDDGFYQIRVSRMSDWRYEFLVFFHELLELAWVIANEIKIEDIDAFDMEYEKNRKEGDVSEPGDDKNAPYFYGHQAATICERVAAAILGVEWSIYNNEVENL